MQLNFSSQHLTNRNIYFFGKSALLKYFADFNGDFGVFDESGTYDRESHYLDPKLNLTLTTFLR